MNWRSASGHLIPRKPIVKPPGSKRLGPDTRCALAVWLKAGFAVQKKMARLIVVPELSVIVGQIERDGFPSKVMGRTWRLGFAVKEGVER